MYSPHACTNSRTQLREATRACGCKASRWCFRSTIRSYMYYSATTYTRKYTASACRCGQPITTYFNPPPGHSVHLQYTFHGYGNVRCAIHPDYGLRLGQGAHCVHHPTDTTFDRYLECSLCNRNARCVYSLLSFGTVVCGAAGSQSLAQARRPVFSEFTMSQQPVAHQELRRSTGDVR